MSEDNIQQSVLERIKTGDVSMHSRVFFVVRAIGIGLLALLVLAGSLFLFSYILFSVDESGQSFLLDVGFGNDGWLTFLSLFPWSLFFFAVVLLLALELLMRHYTTAYRFSFLRLSVWMLLVGVSLSTLVSVTPLHSALLSASDNDKLPLIAPLYKQINAPHIERGIFRGDVASITDSMIIISHDDGDRDTDDESWTIVPPPTFDVHSLSVGKKVFVSGRLKDGVVEARGIRELEKKGKKEMREKKRELNPQERAYEDEEHEDIR